MNPYERQYFLNAQPSTRVYSAESQVRNFRAVVSDMFGGLLSSRYVSYRLARKDIKEGYSASALGWVWDLLDPLVLSGIFYYLMQTRLISSEGLGMPPSLFVVYGMMLYQTYTESLVLSTELMQRSRNLLTHLRVSPEALIMSVAYRVGFNSFFRIVVMLGFSLFAGEFSSIGFLKFVLCFPLIIFWGMAPGILMAPFHAIYSDVGRVVRLLILPLRFLAPVLYAIPSGTLLGKFQIFNPVAPVLVNLRSVAVNNTIVEIPTLLTHFLILIVLGVIGWFLFHISIPVIAERSQ